MSDILLRLRLEKRYTMAPGLMEEAADEIERLRAALKRLVHDSMYKDHPEASQMAIDALGGVDAALFGGPFDAQ